MREALIELYDVPLSPQQREVVRLISIHGPVTAKRLFTLYYDTPAPPEGKAMHALSVTLMQARKRIEPHGWSITRGESHLASDAHRIGMLENRYELFRKDID